MESQVFHSRIIHKHDLEENWIKAVNFIPKQGEIIVYDIDNDYEYERLKVGDGVTNVNALPFINSQADFSIEDENNPSYIKNKPEIATNEDITEFISEIGIADPVTASDGSIYTNANGDIYVL